MNSQLYLFKGKGFLSPSISVFSSPVKNSATNSISDMIIHLLIFSVILIITSPPSSSSAKADCTRVCISGGRKTPVQFPFGFTSDCEIRLDCSEDGKIQVGGYDVHNFTRDHILINLPAKCDRQFEEIRLFGGPNYALTSRNGLLLENCNSTLNDCVVSPTIVENLFNLQQCNLSTNRSMNCYSEDINPDREEFLNLNRLDSAGCKVLFSSVIVELNGIGSESSAVSLDFQSLQLGWWVHGDCSCHRNADCRNVSFENTTMGYRCHCNEGYDGDGFRNGNGCHRVIGNPRLCEGVSKLHLPKCRTKKRRKLSLRVVVAISLSSTVAAMAIVSLVLVYCCMKKKREKPSESTLTESFEKISYGRLFKATEGFSEANLIGTGGFGSVYKGVVDENGLTVAIKVLNLQRRGGSRSFMAECEALRNIRHRNLVKVVTSCSSLDFQRNDFKALVYDFMPNGSLETWLHSSMTVDHLPHDQLRQLDLVQRINIAKDVACALDYLHYRCGNVVVHRDLKPSNILLDADMVAHVGDFGLAKILSLGEVSDANKSSSSHVRGTIGYAPPEYGLGNKVSTGGDIYSYGILVLEMMTGKKPIDPMFREGLSLHSYATSALAGGFVLQIVDPMLLHDDVKEMCLISLVEIGVKCSSESPQDRMDIGTVIHELLLVTVTATS